VNATTASGTTPWSNGTAITVNAAGPSIPAPPSQLDPSGTITTITPTYRWNASTGATSYYLVVQNTSGVTIGESHTAAEVGCSGGGTGVCSYTPAVSLAHNTVYSWFVNATNDLGTSAWSAGKSITTQ
jgi:hypothetical protein